MSYASLDDLRSQLGGPPVRTPEYIAKMLHPFPATKSVVRAAFLRDHCTNKRVLEFGASGKMHEQIVEVASKVVGIDRLDTEGVHGFDLDDVMQGYVVPPAVLHYWPEIIICGEVLEHLSNPGWFLHRLKRGYAGVPVIITVPNAFSSAGTRWAAKGIENVNVDHVAWYSPHTISVLLARAGYATGGLFYYGGDGPTAEGLIVVTE